MKSHAISCITAASVFCVFVAWLQLDPNRQNDASKVGTEGVGHEMIRGIKRALGSRKLCVDDINITTSPRADGVEKWNVINEWNLHAINSVIADHNYPGKPANLFSCTMGPAGAALQLAKVHLAMFDAYNSIDTFRTPYLTKAVASGDPAVVPSIDAAVAQAGYEMLLNSYPIQGEALDMALKVTLQRVTDPDARAQGIEIGSKVAQAMIAHRLNDGSCPNYLNYTFVSGPGQHQPDPFHPGQNVLSPQFGYVTPLVMENLTEYIPVPPLDLASAEYAAELNQVKTLGGNGKGTPTTREWDETVTAVYHAYDGSPWLGPPPIMLNDIARQMARQMGVSDNPRETALLYARVHAAMGDSAIACWGTKFIYNFWRPVVAIQKADIDGNPDTEADKTWKFYGAPRSNPMRASENNFSPPFPSYTSGHATFCAAAMKAIMNHFQINDIAFNFTSWEWNGTTYDDRDKIRPFLVQEFESLSLFSAQCAASRIFAGVHFNMDATSGAWHGNKIADRVYEAAMLPLDETTPTKFPTTDYVSEIGSYLNRTRRAKIFIPGVPDDQVQKIVENHIK